MSKISLKMVEEMQYPWKYGQSFHPYSTLTIDHISAKMHTIEGGNVLYIEVLVVLLIEK